MRELGAVLPRLTRPRHHLRPRRSRRRAPRPATWMLEGVRRRGAPSGVISAATRASRSGSACSTLQVPGRHIGAERAGGRRGRARARRAVRDDRLARCANSRAPSAASSGAASSTASPSSTTTAITRPRSPRCSRPRAPTLGRRRRRRVPAASLHAHPRPDATSSATRWRPPTRSCSPTSTRPARIRFPA